MILQSSRVLIENEKICGAVNVTAPNPITNKEIYENSTKKIKIPFGIASPVWLLEIMSIFSKSETELLLKVKYFS